MKRRAPLLLSLGAIGATAFMTSQVVSERFSSSSDVLHQTGRMRLIATEVAHQVLIQDEATQSMLLDPGLLAEVSEVKTNAFDRQNELMRELSRLAPDDRLQVLIKNITLINDTKLKPLDQLLLKRMAEGQIDEARASYHQQYVPARAEYNRQIDELAKITAAQAIEAERSLSDRAAQTNHVLMLVFGLSALLVTGLFWVNRGRRKALDANNRMQQLVVVTRQLLKTNSVAAMLETLTSALGIEASIEAHHAQAASFSPGRVELPLSDSQRPLGTLLLHTTVDGPEAQGFWLNLSISVAQHLTALRMALEMNQGQKLESVGRLASGIAHEINTPVQFVSDSVHFVSGAFKDLGPYVDASRALLEAAKTGTVTAELISRAEEAQAAADLEYTLENVPKALERSLDGLNRVAKLVLSMKAFAHPDRTSKDPADINKAIADTLTIASNEYRYVAEVETSFAEVPKVVCHINELNQVFLNLIVNSAHAIADRVHGTPDKGRIRIATRVDGGDVEIAISDTGGGIPDSIREKIFEPFFTTKEVGKGTGQGLAIARSVVVEKHAGSLTFTTDPGVGTTFTIRLPIQ